jgi:aryl-alcohol dehydrogenase-like predicted oxidoreductase
MWRRLHGDAEARERLVRKALDLGISSIDTAPLYGFGASEELLGRALSGVREKAQILTKVGLRWDSNYGEKLFTSTADGVTRVVRRDCRPRSIRKDVEESLARLRTDRLDLVQVHYRDRDTPLADTMGELCRLRSEGKLREVGLCNFQPIDIGEAARELGEVPLRSVQDLYNLIERESERRRVPAARAARASFLCYSPLGRGLLGGCLLELPPSQWPQRGPLFQRRNVRAAHRAIEDCLRPIAEHHGASLAQVALAWLLGAPGVTGVICGASSEQQLIDNAGTRDLTLSQDEQAALSDRFSSLRLAPEAGQGLPARVRGWFRRRRKNMRRRR